MNPTAAPLSVPDIDPADDTLTAALKYAKAGWYVGPCDQAQKSPGSVLGKGWPLKTSRDPQQIVAWFAGEPHGLFLHVGRSGGLVLDVDDYDTLPGWVDALINEQQPPFQSTREADPRRGHYVFAQPADRVIGNGGGTLGKGWGEVRGANGVVVVQPTVHEKPGGRYQWQRTGPVPFSQKLADGLPSATDSADPATDAAVATFLTAHAADTKPRLLTVVVDSRTADIAAGGSRHDAARDHLAWAMREARAGLYPARDAVGALWSVFDAAMRARPDASRHPRAEFGSLLAWAVAQAMADDVEARAAAVAERTAPLAPMTDDTDEPTKAAEDDEDARPPSWAPEDLTAHLDGSHEPLEATLLPREDGAGLLYRGKVHSVHGESESGKSFLLHAESARLLTLGQDVVIVDYESTAATVVPRLLAMGAPTEAIRSHLRYIRPERTPLALDEWPAWTDLLARPAALVVLDGVTEALATMGHSTIDNDEVTGWVRSVPRKIAQATGAAVVLVDHVTKSTEGRGRFAIGAQAKLAALDGASYSLEVVEPLGRGMRGTLRLWIGKDREGAIRPRCGRFNPADRTQLAATIVVDSTTGAIQVDVLAPEELVGTERKPFRPTVLMERLSRAVEDSPAAVSSNALVKGDEFVPGKKEHKATALRLLVAEGYVTRTAGPRNSQLHTTAKVYREATDPLTGRGPSQPSLSGREGLSVTGTGSPYREGDPGPSQQTVGTGSGTQSGPSGTQSSDTPTNPSAAAVDPF